MGVARDYLDRHSFFKPFISSEPVTGTSLIVVIPCFNEPDILTSLESLFNARRPSFPVEVIIVINSPAGVPEEVTKQNRETLWQIREWKDQNRDPAFAVYPVDVPPFSPRHAGAGFARKTGMDEAVHRFNLLENEGGIIVSFDADSKCDTNYFTEIERCFSGTGIKGCTVYFEHPVGQAESGECRQNAISEYELYLRYYIQGLRMAGFPYAFHTIGSCFAVNAAIYAQNGGMNRKKAGEDFYFLHKIFPLGRFTELNSTRVIPSSRISDRVPFGTGAVMKRMAGNSNQKLKSYPLQSFDELTVLFSLVPDLCGSDHRKREKILRSIPQPLRAYLVKNDFHPAVENINMHSASLRTFKKRFFSWFNALQILKYLNFARKNCRCDAYVSESSAELLRRCGMEATGQTPGLLTAYRNIQRRSVWMT